MSYDVHFNINLKKNPYPGLYIALEGIDGSGKTTQVERLAQYFEKQGKTVVRTHEPRRDGVMGELVSNILKQEKKIPEVAIQYLFAAQRAVHLEDLVTPSLESGAVVISDRSFWSSIPYGLLDRFETGKSEDPDVLLASLSILSMYHEFIAPDIAVVLDVSVETAGERLSQMKRRAELYEKKEKLTKINEGYSFLLKHFADALLKVDAEQDMEAVTKEVLSHIEKLNK